MQNKKAFTLVELIVVVTILWILSTIWFVAYSGYLVWVRDTNRTSQLKSISDWLELYRTKHNLPLPDDYVEIKANGDVIAYQWYAWKNVLESIEYTSEWVDPKDKTYYSYYLTKDKKYYQLMWFLEENSKNEEALIITKKTNAIDYSIKIPTVYWNKLWILTDTLNTPIQEIPKIKSAWFLDIATTNKIFNAHFDDSNKLIWTWSSLYILKPLASIWWNKFKLQWKSCKDLINKYKNIYWLNWIYQITIDNKTLQVYCDMTTNWWGRTLVHKTTSSTNNLSWDLTSNEWKPNWDNNEEYRLSINYWKDLSTEKAMATNIRVDWLKWNDIENWTISYIWTDKVDFTVSDKYRIFWEWTLWNGENNCTNWTNYWNGSCCARCVNLSWDTTYWAPDNSPMLNKSYTSTTESAIEWAWWTQDDKRHRLSKMWIFIK